MSRWIVVPIRGLAAGKSRLASVLDNAGRFELNRMMLDRVLEAVASCEGSLEHCLVVSANADALAMASSYGAVALCDRPCMGLNTALELARKHAVANGATSVLTLAADLPDVTGDALRRFLADKPADAAALIADKHGHGTNGMLLPTASTLCFTFGEGSLARHMAAFVGEGRNAHICRDPALAFDLDSPADYASWRARAHYCAVNAS